MDFVIMYRCALYSHNSIPTAQSDLPSSRVGPDQLALARPGLEEVTEEVPHRRLGRLRQQVLVMFHLEGGQPNLSPDRVYYPRVNWAARGISDVESVLCLPGSGRDLGPLDAQAVLPEYPRDVCQETESVFCTQF